MKTEEGVRGCFRLLFQGVFVLSASALFRCGWLSSFFLLAFGVALLSLSSKVGVESLHHGLPVAIGGDSYLPFIFFCFFGGGFS